MAELNLNEAVQQAEVTACNLKLDAVNGALTPALLSRYAEELHAVASALVWESLKRQIPNKRDP